MRTYVLLFHHNAHLVVSSAWSLTAIYTCAVLIAIGLSRLNYKLDAMRKENWGKFIGFGDLTGAFTDVWRIYAFIGTLFVLYVMVCLNKQHKKQQTTGAHLIQH